MKKILTVFCSACIVLLAGCGDDSSTSANEPSANVIESSSMEEQEAAFSSSSVTPASSNNNSEPASSSSINSGSSDSVPISSSSENKSSSSNKVAEESSSSEEVSSSSAPFNPCGDDAPLKENWKFLNPDIKYDCIQDSRDKQYYATVKIGDYTWMAENMEFGAGNSYNSEYSWSGYSSKDYDFNHYRGTLYSWDLAMDDKNCLKGNLCYARGMQRGICPEGFHIPTYGEWQDLFKTVGGEDIAARELKSTKVWADSAKGTDKYGFSVIPHGPRYAAAGYNPLDFNAHYWTSIEGGETSVVTVGFTSSDKVNGFDFENKEFAFSVRCLMDYPEKETVPSTTPHDPDKIYECSEMLMDDINTWHFISSKSEDEFQYFVDDRDSISVHIKDFHSEFTTKLGEPNTEQGLYYTYWIALSRCR